MNDHIQTAIAIAGGTQKALAARCGVTQAAVSLWLLGGRVSAENAMAIERATAGAVKARDIRPDVFDPPTAPVTVPETAPVELRAALHPLRRRDDPHPLRRRGDVKRPA